jgi:hypothetical protein
MSKVNALICITTAKRSTALKALVWDYLAICQTSPSFQFLVALDGDDAETRSFCQHHGIPVLWSEAQEGVGLSKNRVLKAFPNFDHYFFIEDDVELLDGRLFEQMLSAAQELGIHHMSLFPEERIEERVEEKKLSDGRHVICSLYGSAQINYFSRKGIEQVGGFHTEFAKYRRFGHTEHSYRYVHAGLAQYPFYVPKECLEGYVRWSDPISVTKIKVARVNRLFADEHALIQTHLAYFPLTTLAAYHPPESLDLGKVRRPWTASLNKIRFKASMTLLDVLRRIKKLIKP